MAEFGALAIFALTLVGMVAYARRMETRPEQHRRRVPTPVLLMGPVLAFAVVMYFVAIGESVADAIVLAAPALIGGVVSLVWALLRTRK